MDWREKASSFLVYLDGLPVPKWVAPATTLAALLLLIVVMVQSARTRSLRYQLAQRGDAGGRAQSTVAAWEDQVAPISLEGEGHALVDRLLPRHPPAFLLVVAIIALGCWALGLALANDPLVFLKSREWQVQPVYMAAHFITLRLFAGAFTRSFLSGVAHLDIAAAEVQRRMRLVLGPVGVLVALAVAVPFCLYDYRFAYADTRLASDSLGLWSDRLLFAIWCVEWFLLAFIWVMLLGYMLLTRWAVGWHRFRSPIEVVLHDKQYRPFLRMSANGATIMLGFWIINLAYSLYSGAEISDYTGAAITLILVVVGFLPPLLLLRAKVKRAVNEEMARLRLRLAGVLARPGHAAAGDAPPATPRELEERLDEALVMLRISYLERLYGELGHTEALDILIKLLVPATTMAWYGYKASKGMG